MIPLAIGIINWDACFVGLALGARANQISSQSSSSHHTLSEHRLKQSVKHLVCLYRANRLCNLLLVLPENRPAHCFAAVPQRLAGAVAKLVSTGRGFDESVVMESA